MQNKTASRRYGFMKRMRDASHVINNRRAKGRHTLVKIRNKKRVKHLGRH